MLLTTYIALPPTWDAFLLFTNIFSLADPGALSRKSTISYVLFGSRTRANPPPEIPLLYIPNRSSQVNIQYTPIQAESFTSNPHAKNRGNHLQPRCQHPKCRKSFGFSHGIRSISPFLKHRSPSQTAYFVLTGDGTIHSLGSNILGKSISKCRRDKA